MDVNHLIDHYTIELKTIKKIKFNRILYDKDILHLLSEINLNKQAQEQLLVIYLSSNKQILSYSIVSQGSLNASVIHAREVFKGAFLANANSIVLAHNHPQGVAFPSKEDIEVTDKIKFIGNFLDLPLCDHLIVSGTEHFSFVENNLFSDTQSIQELYTQLLNKTK